MSEQERITQVLAVLDGIANAPMTEGQRQERAEPVLRLAGVSVSDVAQALSSPDLPWNQGKAQEHGVAVDTWLEAERIVRLPQSQSLAELLARIHQAEAAVTMLKAGYRAQVDASGRIAWLSPQRA